MRKLEMEHGTEDASAAYRHVPAAQPEYTCVAVWDADAEDVVFCEVPGSNFGLKSAVLNYNRFPELGVALARRLLWMCTEHYFDANDICVPTFARRSGQASFIALTDMLGFPCETAKHVAMRADNEFLGVLELAHKHQFALLKGPASSIFGKARFMLTPAYGAVGRACL